MVMPTKTILCPFCEKSHPMTGYSPDSPVEVSELPDGTMGFCNMCGTLLITRLGKICIASAEEIAQAKQSNPLFLSLYEKAKADKPISVH